LLLTQDREATWWWGGERLDSGELGLVDGVPWPSWGGAEEGFGCGGVWRCSGLLYIGQGQGGGQPSGGIMAPVNARHSLPISVSR
jgi:hypothetical protein